MAILQSIYRVGIGGDYPNWNDAIADLPQWTGFVATSIPMTGNITLVQISDIDMSARASESQLLLGGHKLRFTSSRLHQGDPNNAWRTRALSGITFSTMIHVGPYALAAAQGIVGHGTIEMDNLYFYSEENDLLALWLDDDVAVGGIETQSTYDVHDNLFDMNLLGRECILLDVENQNPSRAWNNKMWNHKASTRFAIRTRYALIENNTAYSTAAGADGFEGRYMRNNVAACSGTCFSWLGGDESYNNASQDATSQGAPTQSGNLINIVPADQFLSLDPTSPDFLKPRGDGQIYNMGLTPVVPGNNHGIEGNVRPWTLRGVA